MIEILFTFDQQVASNRCDMFCVQVTMAHTKFGVNMPKHCRDTASSVILASCLKFVVVVCENCLVYHHKIHNFLSACSEDDLI